MHKRLMPALAICGLFAFAPIPGKAFGQSKNVEDAKRRAAERRAEFDKKVAAMRADVDKPSAPAAAAPAPAAPGAPASFQPDQAVEVREGDAWSKATFVKREGRKLQIRYEDGTEEWVTADRVRVPGGGADEAAPADGKAAATKKAPKEQFAIGAKVEVKSASSWKPAKIKNRDGDLYLIIYDGWESETWWEWVPTAIVRTPGSAKEFHDWGRGVKVGLQGVAKAKAEAKLTFANIDAEVAAAAKGGGKRDPFAPEAYDKDIADAKLDKLDDLVVGNGPAKLAAFDPAPAVKLAERGYVLKGKAAARHGGGGPAALLLAGARAVAAYTNDAHGSNTRTTSLEILDLAGGRAVGIVEADPLSMPVDLSPSGDRMIGVQHGFHSGTKVRLDVHALKPGAKPEHLISFVPYAGKDLTFARFVADEDHVLTANRDGYITLWDAPKATAIWQLRLSGGATPAVSPGRKQIAFIDDGALFVVEALTGKVLCRIPGERVVRSLSFSPDGKTVLGVSGSTVAAWDLEQGKALPDIGMPAAGNGGDAVALDARFVLIGGSDLLDLEKKVVVWRYNAPAVFGGGGMVRVHGGQCWRVATDDQRPVLTSAKLPHDAARKAADAIPVGHGLLVKPGERVALNVAIDAQPDQQKRVVDAITAQLAQAGIKVDPNSPIKLNARTEQGQVSTRTYQVREFGRPFDQKTETVSVTEKITRVFFELDGKVAWENRTSSGGAPMMVHTKQGQTINDAVQAGSQFNVAFLESVRVPSYVPLPRATPWLGESNWGLSGLGQDRLLAPLPAAPAAPGAAAQVAPRPRDNDGLD